MGQVVQGHGNSGALPRLSGYQSFVPTDCPGKCILMSLPDRRNGALFDNSLNDKRFRIDIRVENGYEKGCTRGANFSS